MSNEESWTVVYPDVCRGATVGEWRKSVASEVDARSWAAAKSRSHGKAAVETWGCVVASYTNGKEC